MKHINTQYLFFFLKKERKSKHNKNAHYKQPESSRENVKTNFLPGPNASDRSKSSENKNIMLIFTVVAWLLYKNEVTPYLK